MFFRAYKLFLIFVACSTNVLSFPVINSDYSNFPMLKGKEKPKIIFFTGGNSLMPYEIYSRFVDKLRVENDVSIVKNSVSVNAGLLSPISFFGNFEKGTTENNDIFNQLLEIIDYGSYTGEIIALGHSSGCSTLVNYCSRFKNINKCILIDPVNNNGDSLKKPDFNSTLIIKADKSYKWKFEGMNPIPKKAPFIPAFEMKSELFENPEIITMEGYGHCDILDPLWSNVMHNSIAEGTEDRDSIDKYKDTLVEEINNFIQN